MELDVGVHNVLRCQLVRRQRSWPSSTDIFCFYDHQFVDAGWKPIVSLIVRRALADEIFSVSMEREEIQKELQERKRGYGGASFFWQFERYAKKCKSLVQVSSETYDFGQIEVE